MARMLPDGAPMSTRSRIGILNADGTVTSVYCRFDGYPTGVGLQLTTFHNSEEAARSLISLGGLSSVSRGEVVAYVRDRGEDMGDNAGETHPIDRWPDSGMEYAYLWRDGGWLVAANGYGPTVGDFGATFVSVPDLIAAEEEAE